MTAAATATIALADTCWHHDWGGGWFFFPFFWVLVVVAILFLVRRGGWRRGRHYGPPRESAAELLDRRFAQGEIDVEEYRRRRSVFDERDSG